MRDPDAPWWDRAFGAEYLGVYAHRDDASAAREAAFAAEALGIDPGARVLDLGCGAGRHLRALEARGVRAAGMDRSAALLAEARRRGAASRLVRGDLRALPFRTAAFDHVVSFFTSFGYFDEAGDRAQLREMRRVLRSGGGTLLDYLNAPHVAATLVPSSERTEGARIVREERVIRRGRVEKTVEVTVEGRVTAAWCESVRLWSREEVAALLGDAGFRVRSEHGDLAGAPWSVRSARLVVVAEAA